MMVTDRFGIRNNTIGIGAWERGSIPPHCSTWVRLIGRFADGYTASDT